MMETLTKLNEQLSGAPIGVLLMLFAIAVGYVLKICKSFENKYIPIVVVNLCAICYILLAPKRDVDTLMRIYYTRNFILGYLFGFFAWLLHSQLLRRFLDPYIIKPTNDEQSGKPTKL